MPQRHHPIPRFDGQISSQQPLEPLATLSTRRDREVLPPRHRAGSLHTQSGHGRDRSPSIAPTASLTTSNTPNSSTMPSTGGGERRSSGRALPPPRFQRKQRPPRVQQALAAANSSNQSGSSHSHGRNRRGTNADSNVSGTLTLGPANNWGAGTTSVASLSMATINAASARGSVIRRQQHDRPLPQAIHPPAQLAPQLSVFPTSTDLDVGEMLEEEASFGSDMDFRGMDPVQLHNRLTFGMGRPTHSDSFASDHPHGFNALEPDILEPTAASYLPPYASPSTVETYSIAANTISRQRSKSHNQPNPSPYPQSSHLTNPYGYIADSPSASQSSFSSISLQQPSFDPEAQSRFRSRSLMAPVGMVDPSIQAPAFTTGALPPLPGRTRLQPPNALPASSSTPHLTLDTRTFDEDLTLTVQSGTSNLVARSPTTKRPLKSALKVRKSAPELVDTSLANTFDSANYPPFELPQVPARLQAQPPYPHHASASVLNRHPSSAAPHEQSSQLPDPHFALPDSLQAQYAYQLRLLQQEYADKAAKAEAMRRGTGGTARPAGFAPSDRAVNGVEVGDVTRQYAGMKLGGQAEVMDITPPSSGGGSMSGYRVSFQEDVGVIGTSTGSDYAPGYEEAHEHIEYGEGEEGEYGEEYASWDEEWEEHNAEEGIVGEEESYEPANAGGDEEEFNYAFGDGFGSLEPAGQSPAVAPPATIDPRQQTPATTSSISSKASEDDERSDVGDRGHEDRGLESSPVDPLISPTRAVFHGHSAEESPSVSSAANSSDILGRLREAEQEDEAKPVANLQQRPMEERLLIPLVEVIAPTPTLPVLELGGAAFEPQVLKPMEGIEDKVEEKAPRSSEDSAGHKNSSEEGSSGSTESNATVQRQTAGAQTSIRQLPTIHSGTTTPTLPSDIPILAPVSSTSRPVSTSQIPSLSSTDASHPEIPQFPPSLQRLAQRLSRGGSVPMPSVNTASSTSYAVPLSVPQTQGLVHSIPPIQASMPAPMMTLPHLPDSMMRGPARHPALNPHTSAFVPTSQPLTPGASSPYGRTTSSQDSHRSESGRRRSTQQPLARHVFPSQPEFNSTGASNYVMQQELRQRNPSLRSLALSEDINTQLPHPHSAFSHTPSARGRHSSLAFADMSSAASIESGSSHGGGTSGGSHAHPFGRPRTSSSHQSNIGAFTNNTRISPSNAPLSPLATSRLQGNLHGAGGSNEGWEDDRLFSVRSNDSLRAASVTSGRSGGSAGSGKGNRMGLGGESIWTLKEDEGVTWGSEAPSSSGHSITGARNTTPWTLPSLLSDTASLTQSSDGRSHFEDSLFPDEIPGHRGVVRHPYQSLPPAHQNASVTSFQSSGPSFMESPSLPTFKHSIPTQQAYGQSRSTPAFPVYTGSDHSHENLEGRYAPEDLDRLRAMRVAQSRVQAAPYVHPRSIPQNRSQPSLPSHSSSKNGNRYAYAEDTQPLSQLPPMTSSARSRVSLPVLPAQPPFGNVVSLPATGGVFPRLQEIPGPNADGSRMGPAGNGRFKGLFKNRDSRVFK